MTAIQPTVPKILRSHAFQTAILKNIRLWLDVKKYVGRFAQARGIYLVKNKHNLSVNFFSQS